MLLLEGDFRLFLIDFLLIVENTAHIPLMLPAICKPNYCICCVYVFGCKNAPFVPFVPFVPYIPGDRQVAPTFHVGVDGRRGPINRR